MRVKVGVVLALCVALLPGLASAQQTGTIVGKVLDTGGLVLPGVTVEARVERAAGAARDDDGRRRANSGMPALPPGTYTVEFTLSGMATVTRQVEVQLGQDTTVDVKMSVQGVTETVEVTAAIHAGDRAGLHRHQERRLLGHDSGAAGRAGVPGPAQADSRRRGDAGQYARAERGRQRARTTSTSSTASTSRCRCSARCRPSLPSYDIAEVTTIKGGAKAVDFVRAAGFTVDTISKSGTNRFAGQVSYQYQGANMAADVQSGSASRYNQTLNWFNAGVGGPVIPGKLFFYGSYYRPERSRDNRSNLYGELPDYNSIAQRGLRQAHRTRRPARS